MPTYSHEELHAAFQKVKNPTDWKAPINAVIDEKDMDIVEQAIVYITATSGTFTRGKKKGTLRVRADGYRNGPAGP
jgi:hypothetical protein